MNVGRGEGVSVRELVAAFERRLRPRGARSARRRRVPATPSAAYANVDRIAELIGWRAEHSHRRGHRLGAGLDRQAPGDPGLRMIGRLVVAVAVVTAIVVAAPARRSPARPRDRDHRSRWRAGSWSSTPVTSSATTTSRAGSIGWCRPAASASRATPPAPRPTAATRRPAFTWDVALRLRERLRELGARGPDDPAQQPPGPLGTVRRRAAAGPATSSTAAGPPTSRSASTPTGRSARGAHGFHVIAPPDRRPWTHDIYRSSRRLAMVTRAALRRARPGAGDVRRRRRRPRRSRRPRHPEPLRRADGDGRARQHAQPADAAADDPAGGRERYARGAGAPSGPQDYLASALRQVDSATA